MITKDYRPRTFNQIIGHKKTIDFFKQASIDRSYPDVMFFEGNSGSGKTTTALVVASTVNCLSPIVDNGVAQPCGECCECRSILNETFAGDVHFFKSAEMEKEDIINLENLASQTPWHGGKKNIIIIDEIQSLGKSSKEATLNLLEKKRKDTMFILCTMDVSKIDRAILSRGQVYKFKPLSASEIGQSLLNILSAIDPDEKIPISSSVLVTISQNSWGSIRQAQQYLQACIDRKLYDDESIEQELGFFSDEKGYEIFNKLLNKDVSIYSHLKNVKHEDFYIYAWSILSSIEKTIRTGDPEDFKYKSSLAIKNSENYKAVCDLFLDTAQTSQGYFKDYLFDFYLGQYLQNSVPVMRRVREKK